MLSDIRHNPALIKHMQDEDNNPIKSMGIGLVHRCGKARNDEPHPNDRMVWLLKLFCKLCISNAWFLHQRVTVHLSHTFSNNIFFPTVAKYLDLNAENKMEYLTYA